MDAKLLWIILGAITLTTSQDVRFPTVSPGFHIIGGIPENGTFYLTSCLDNCANDKDCYSVDYDSLSRTCWKHRLYTSCKSHVQKPFCTNYKKITCSVPGGYVSATSGYHILHGVQQGGKISLDGCLQVCRDQPVCLAVDYHTADMTCFLHTAASACQALVQKNFCNNYRKTSCNAPAGYVSSSVGFHLLGGSPEVGQYTVEQCQHRCAKEAGCLAVDYDYSSYSCWFHDNLTACSQLVAKDQCVNYRKTTCTLPSGYAEEKAGYHLIGGTQLLGTYTLEQCLTVCTAEPMCASLDYNTLERSCWTHTSDTSCTTPVAKTFCVNYKKVKCEDVSFTTAVPFGAMTTTIPDDGVCPSPFERFDSTRQLSGMLIGTYNTMEICKQMCSTDSTCAAVDYNMDTNECYKHTSVITANVQTGQSCCVHFRKTACPSLTCWTHVKTSSTVNPLVECVRKRFANSIGAVEVDCTGGYCVVDESVTVSDTGVPTFYYERRCDRELPLFEHKGCYKNSTFSRCSCDTTRCNGLTPSAIRSCMGYYPLDGDARDYSLNRRDGRAINLGHTCSDVKMNCSGVFNGTSYIDIPSFINIVMGSLKSDDPYTKLPTFTLAMWVKRTDGAGTMSLVNNGPTSEASFEIQSSAANSGLAVDASFLLEGETTRRSIPTANMTGLNQWNFIAITFSGSTTSSFKLYLNDPRNGAVTKVTTTASTQSPLKPLKISPFGMCIGKQLNITTRPVSVAENFVGLMDEIYIFQGTLGAKDLEAVRDVAN